ncbi:hypothetical protein LISE100100_13270 [Listeria seeligeri]|uniref:hypothetical protein n=1 Tax=Listeria seeligeri TaxID=1640 RepID=UPI0001C4E415|nr:hypothetical protein [Listeria seeligeri]MBC1724517.1 hypothetical protein [Listeria seeligeri]MBF2437226.1 hypothetical protein [Listeria seeligeri]CBH26223.1 hypothetical protein lse_0072 [Listeria seeligeri serovar 1/2b str. SLCC3954]
MKINVKRNTGAMGAASKVSLKLDKQKVKSLKHKEEVELEIQGDSGEVSANQWFFGSKAVKVSAGEAVEIKTNPKSILSFVGVFFLLILSFFLNNLVVSVIALVGVFGAILYFIQNYYVIKPISSSGKNSSTY